MSLAVQPGATALRRALVVDDDRGLCHLLAALLQREGFAVTVVHHGVDGLQQLRAQPFDVVFLDVWMPQMNGFEMLAAAREEGLHPKVVMMTSDDTPQALLRAIGEQAFRFLHKPLDPQVWLEAAQQAVEAKEVLPITVLSAKPHWVELEVPCQRDAAERLYDFLLRLKADLPDRLRDDVAQAFRELLLNAIEWGGQLDPSRRVRVSYVRTPRLLMYRIADPGQGFRFDQLSHAAIANPDPIDHMRQRTERGVRPGGFGLLMTRNMVDELVYNEKQNEVLLVKYLAPETT